MLFVSPKKRWLYLDERRRKEGLTNLLELNVLSQIDPFTDLNAKASRASSSLRDFHKTIFELSIKKVSILDSEQVQSCFLGKLLAHSS